jgi:hypothetical protein
MPWCSGAPRSSSPAPLARRAACAGSLRLAKNSPDTPSRHRRTCRRFSDVVCRVSYLNKRRCTARRGCVSITKAQETKAGHIRVARDNKELGIKVSSAKPLAGFSVSRSAQLRQVRSAGGRLCSQTALRCCRRSPWENGFIESFNARLRDELLNGEIFSTRGVKLRSLSRAGVATTTPSARTPRSATGRQHQRSSSQHLQHGQLHWRQRQR